MKPEQLERLARWLWPDADIRMSTVACSTDKTEEGKRYVCFMDYGDIFKSRRWNPHTSLDDCALAWPVLVGRGLKSEYYEQLGNICCPGRFDIFDILTATAPQIAAALWQVMAGQEGNTCT